MVRCARSFTALFGVVVFWPGPSSAQVSPTSIEMTRERMVDLRLGSSYQVRYLNMSIEQSRLRLQASDASLRSRADLQMTVPSYRAAADNNFDRDLGRNVTVFSERRTWDVELSIRQPVIIPFLGYPTNGYISFNTSIFRRTQPDRDGNPVTDFANDYSLRYTQPLFQPNQLRINLERAELDYENQEINFEGQMLNVANQAEGDYFQLFGNRYEQTISEEFIGNLERAEGIAVVLTETDPAKAIELRQIRVELSNARQELERQQSDYRLDVASLKTELNLPQETEIILEPVIEVTPVAIDLAEATASSLERSRRLRNLAIQQRRNEISLDQTRGQNGMRMNLTFSYGREVQNALRFGDLWAATPDNTYTISITASVPVWDWGQGDSRIETSRLNLERTVLQFDEARASVIADAENEVQNVEEQQARALTLRSNLALSRDISEEGLQLYEAGSIGLQELLQSLVRQRDTAQSFLNAYLGWEQSLRSLEDMMEGGGGFGGGRGGGGGGGGRGGGPGRF